jgi:TonB family protein
MIWNSRQTTATLLLVLFLAPLAAWAQEPSQPPQPQPSGALFGGVEPLMSQQTKVVDLLLAKKWQEAQNLAQQQLLVLAGYVEKYPSLAATALALEALADAGLGKEGTAACRWQAAQAIDPKLANADLSMFGAAGALLKERPYQAPKTPDPETLSLAKAAGQEKKAEGATEEATRPRIIAQQRPVYPLAARRANINGQVIVEAIIDKDGSITNPNILGHQPLGLDVTAVDAVCAWRFKPAMLKGQPVKVYYVLTFNFRVQEQPTSSN